MSSGVHLPVLHWTHRVLHSCSFQALCLVVASSLDRDATRLCERQRSDQTCAKRDAGRTQYGTGDPWAPPPPRLTAVAFFPPRVTVMCRVLRAQGHNTRRSQRVPPSRGQNQIREPGAVLSSTSTDNFPLSLKTGYGTLLSSVPTSSWQDYIGTNRSLRKYFTRFTVNKRDPFGSWKTLRGTFQPVSLCMLRA